MSARLPIFLALLLLAAASGPAWATLRCDGGLVERGDLKVEVLDACGAPDFVDAWRDGLAPYFAAPGIEQWTYNFGPSQLVYLLRFNQGRLQTIDTAGYGFSPSADDSRCHPAEIELRMSKFRLLATCGEPVQRHSAYVLSSTRRLGGRQVYGLDALVPVFRETWIYNFGDDRLLRVVTLENGRVVEVNTGDRGFD